MNSVANKKIAWHLAEMANYRELQGANPYSVLSYRNAAEAIEKFDGPPLSISKFGIGPKIRSFIEELVRTGSVAELEALRKEFPNLADLTMVSGIGNKKAMVLYKRFGVTTRAELLDKHRADLDPKLVAAIEYSMDKGTARISREIVESTITPLMLDLVKVCSLVEVAGSIRRRLPTVKDVDILVSSTDREAAMRVFSGYGRVIASGDRKATVLTLGSLKFQIDLMFVKHDSWGAALCHFTGSKEHNVRMRALANARGLTINEYGIYESSTNKWLGGVMEKDLYDILGIDYVSPENRVA